MKNISQWTPSKFVYNKGSLGASMDIKEVSISSRLPVFLVAKFYEQNIPIYAKGNLLDLGCGKVPLYHVYKDYVTDVTCVDWENSLYKNGYLDHVSDLNDPIPLNDESFDTIILSDVLEHIREPDKLWREMNRVLRTGGTVLINVPFYYWLHEKPFDYYRYTQFALQSFAERNDFEIVQLKAFGGVFEILVDIICKAILPKIRGGKRLISSLQKSAWWFSKSSKGKKLQNSTSQNFPFGYAMIVRKKFEINE